MALDSFAADGQMGQPILPSAPYKLGRATCIISLWLANEEPFSGMHIFRG